MARLLTVRFPDEMPTPEKPCPETREIIYDAVAGIVAIVNGSYIEIHCHDNNRVVWAKIALRPAEARQAAAGLMLGAAKIDDRTSSASELPAASGVH